MRRQDPRPWICVGLLAFVLVYVGCKSETDPPRLKEPAAAGVQPLTEHPAAPVDSNKLFANFGTPAGVLIISGERNGYLEPCGCSEDQSGGLIRLYDMVDRLKQQKWPVALIDLGGLVKNPTAARGGFEQTKIKLDYAIRALALLKYSGLALGVEDLKVGVGEALGLFLNSLGDQSRIVVANVGPLETYQSVFAKSVTTAIGPVKLGITAIIDPALLEGLADPDREALLPKVTRPEDVLPGVLADLESRSDYQILMVQGPPELAKRMATAYPGFDIVVSTSEFPEPLSSEPELLNGGKTRLITVGHKGRNVGVLGFYSDPSNPPKFQLQILNKRFDGPGTATNAMKKLIQDEYRETLKAAGVVENMLRHELATAPSGSRFVGAETCKTCHPRTYENWLETGHASAFETLLGDKKPNTQYDAECVSCHTTGFEINSGWISAEKTPHLEGNQCENCHGPASRHIAEPDNKEFLKAMHLTADRADKNRQCIQCHDEENSREFEFTRYWKKVVHNGLDNYKDPRVHQPLARAKPAPEPSRPKEPLAAPGGGR